MQKANDVCEQIRASYLQAQDHIKTLAFENKQMAQDFDTQRLELEKRHLEEIARLHTAVKSMKQQAISFDKHRNSEIQQTIENQVSKSSITKSTIDVADIGETETEALTTIDPHQNIYQED